MAAVVSAPARTAGAGAGAGAREATLLPMVVAAATERDAEPPPTEPSQIEIALGRTPVRVTGSVDPALLELILTHVYR